MGRELAWVKKKVQVEVCMSCYLLCRKHCVFKRMWFNCANRIQQALQLFLAVLSLFCASFIQMKLTSLCKLFCVTFKIMKITMKENKKSYLIPKKESIRGHSFMTSTKKSKIPPSPPLPLSTSPIYKHPILVWDTSTLGRP